MIPKIARLNSLVPGISADLKFFKWCMSSYSIQWCLTAFPIIDGNIKNHFLITDGGIYNISHIFQRIYELIFHAMVSHCFPIVNVSIQNLFSISDGGIYNKSHLRPKCRYHSCSILITCVYVYYVIVVFCCCLYFVYIVVLWETWKA